MSLVLHFFKKDLRRSHLLLAGWILLVAVQYAIMASSLHPGERFAQLLFGAVSDNGPSLRMLVLAVLVALIVQEEAPAGTTGFWLTRPMPRPTVLWTKALVALGLLMVPALGEFIVLASGGSASPDIALAVPEVALNELQVILIAGVLAALTPTFARFALAGAGCWVGYYLISLVAGWLSVALRGEHRMTPIDAASLWHSRTVARDVFVVLGLGTAFAHQYLTRRTARTIILVVLIECGVIAINQAWPWNLFPAPPKPAPTLTLDPASIHTTLMNTEVQEMPDYENTAQPRKNIVGEFLLTGVPAGYLAIPARINPGLTRPDGQAVAAREPGQSNYILEMNSDLFEAALGKVFVYGRTWENTSTPSGIVQLDAAAFRQNAQQRLSFSADVNFELNQFIVTARLPLAKGSHLRQGSDHKSITDVLREGSRVNVIFERSYLDLLLARKSRPSQPERYAVYLNYSAGNKIYVLFNPSRREVIRSASNGSNSLGQPQHIGRIVRESWQFTFGPDRDALTPDLSEAWLAGAELVELEMKPAAEFTQHLAIKDFILEGANRSTARPPSPRLSDPEWLSRFALPESATKEQMTAYVNSVVAASPYWHANSGSEVPVAMLSKVGAGHVGLLLEALDRLPFEYGPANTVMLAILRTAGPQDKESVVRALATHPQLVELVVKYKWQAETRDTLLAAIRDEKRIDLPRSWIRAAAALEDPATYPDLKAYLIRDSGRQATYNAIKKLPGISLDEAIAAAWKQAHTGPKAGLVDAAAMAVDVGYPDALEVLINVLRENDPGQPQQVQRSLTLVARYLPAKGDAATLVKWYDANKSRLSFNVAEKKFLPLAP